MEDSEQEKVIRNLKLLAEKTRSLYKVMTFLVANEILTVDERHYITLLPDNSAKSFHLYTILVNKKPNAYKILLEVLNLTGNEDLAKKIDTTDPEEERGKDEGIKEYQIIGAQDEFQVFRMFPLEIQSVIKLIISINFYCVEIDASTFPQNLEECSNVTKVKLNKVRTTGLFKTTAILPNLKEFYFDKVEAQQDIHNTKNSLQQILFLDTKKSEKDKVDINQIWLQNCNVTLAFDGKVLIQTNHKDTSFTSSVSDADSFLIHADNNLRKLALNRVKFQQSIVPSNLSELTLYMVDLHNLATLVHKCTKLISLRVFAKDYQSVNVCHLSPCLKVLSLGFINVVHSPGYSFSLDSLAFDSCTLEPVLVENFQNIFRAKSVYVGGPGFLAPSSILLRSILRMDCGIEWICLVGFDDVDGFDVETKTTHQITEFLTLVGIRRGETDFTLQIVNGSWVGKSCNLEELATFKYELYGWNKFWTKEAYSRRLHSH